MYRFDSTDNFKTLTDYFTQVNAICRTFGTATDDMNTIVRLVLDKIKASGEVGKLISENLKAGGPIVNIMDLWARWAVKAREIARAKDITATYLEPRGGGRRDNRGTDGGNIDPLGRESNRQRKKRLRRGDGDRPASSQGTLQEVRENEPQD